jgi:hypothetical protein
MESALLAGQPRGSEAEARSPEEYSSAGGLSMVKETGTAKSFGLRCGHGRRFPRTEGGFLAAPGGAVIPVDRIAVRAEGPADLSA